MTFRPLRGRVVVRRVDESATSGGTVVPDTAKEKPMQGEVVAVGPGARDEAGRLVAPEIRTGVFCSGKWSGTDVKIDGEDLLILVEADILGLLDGGVSSKRKAA